MSKEQELIAEHALTYCIADEGRCACGYWFDASDNPGVQRIQRMHAAHVVSRLSEHGYSIVPARSTAMALAETLGNIERMVRRTWPSEDVPNTYISMVRAAAAAAAEEDQ